MTKTAYWQSREQRAREAYVTRETGQTEKILAVNYIRSRKAVEAEMERLYLRITRETEKTGQPLLSALYKFNRYYDLTNNLSEEIHRLTGYGDEIMSRKYTELYEHIRDDVVSQYGDNGGFRSGYRETDAVRVVNGIWCQDGKSWSDRTWQNGEILKAQLTNGFIDILAGAKSDVDLIKMIRYSYDVSYSNAARLVRTEMNHIYNQAALDGYAEAGIEKYRYLTHVSEVCDDCTSLNGKTFTLAGAQTGVNKPPMHPNCKCTVLAVTELDEMGAIQMANIFDKKGADNPRT